MPFSDPVLKSPYIEYAINNLRVRRNTEPRTERAPQAVQAPPAELSRPADSVQELQNDSHDVAVKPAARLV
jgi:hypothetical protein